MCRKMSNYNLLCYSRIGSMMKFNLGRDNICTQNTLTSCKYEKNILEIEEIQFQTSAIDNVRDILNNGIKRNN